MHKLLDTSTASIPTGVSPQRKLFKLGYGSYAGRLVCLFGESSGNINMSWADSPYSSWKAPSALITDSADYPFSACLDRDGNIYVVYVQQTTLNLIFFKLVFSAGTWNSGSPATVLNAGSGYYPVIARADSGDLWCAFAYYNSGDQTYTIRIKSSTDGGATWGSGPADTGTALSGSSSDMAYVNLNFIGNDLYAVYSQSRSNLCFRKRDSSSGTWDSAVSLFNSNYIDSEFDCAVSDDLKLGIAVCPSSAGNVYFREYDGVNLSGLHEAAAVSARAPQIIYKSTLPYIFYARNIGNDLFLPCYAYKDNQDFTAGVLIDGIGFFDKVILYNSGAQTYQDKTDEAISADAADVCHSSSNAVIDNTGDCLYIGMDSRFFCAAIILSTAGNGGAVIWEYYNGTEWNSFVPGSGAYNFDESNKIVYLWDDLESTPSDWQSNSVNSENKFWVRARVTGDFTTAPVGTQIAAAPKSDYLSAARGDR